MFKLILLTLASAQQIVEINDWMDVFEKKDFDKGNLTNPVYHKKFHSLNRYQSIDRLEQDFRMMNNQSAQNTSQKISMCYVERNESKSNIDQYYDGCLNNKTFSDTQGWLLVSNALDEQDDNLELLRNVSRENSTNKIQGLLMMSDYFPRFLNDTDPEY